MRPRVVGVRVPVEAGTLRVGLDGHDRARRARRRGPAAGPRAAGRRRWRRRRRGRRARRRTRRAARRAAGARARTPPARHPREAHVVLEARLAAAVVAGVDARQDERQRVRPCGAQRAGGAARPVAHPLGDLAHVRRGRRADRAAPVERQGHRRRRDACRGGHVADRRAHGLHRPRTVAAGPGGTTLVDTPPIGVRVPFVKRFMHDRSHFGGPPTQPRTCARPPTSTCGATSRRSTRRAARRCRSSSAATAAT